MRIFLGIILGFISSIFLGMFSLIIVVIKKDDTDFLKGFFIGVLIAIVLLSLLIAFWLIPFLTTIR